VRRAGGGRGSSASGARITCAEDRKFQHVKASRNRVTASARAVQPDLYPLRTTAAQRAQALTASGSLWVLGFHHNSRISVFEVAGSAFRVCWLGFIVFKV
jgi:hypothetical protein